MKYRYSTFDDNCCIRPGLHQRWAESLISDSDSESFSNFILRLRIFQSLQN